MGSGVLWANPGIQGVAQGPAPDCRPHPFPSRLPRSAPPPTPAPPPPAAVLGGPQEAPVVQAPYIQPPPPPPPVFAPPGSGPGGYGPYDPASTLPSLYFAGDLFFLQPTVTGTRVANTHFDDGTPISFAAPHTSLNFTVSPRLEVGYRLPDNAGAFSLSYRFLNAQGTGTAADDSGPLSLRSRLALNVLDFDYSTARYSPLPRYNLKWRLGARLLTAFFDDRGQNAIFSESASNNFVGAGPHAGLDIEREIALVTGLALFGRVDGAVEVGQIRQRYRTDLTDASGDTTITTFGQNRTQSSPNLTLEAGLSYSPPRMDYLRFTAGYHFEHFWELGRDGPSRGDVQTQGGFLRGEFDF